MADPNPLLKLLPEKVSERVYDDALAGTTKQVGEALADIAGTLRWFTAPFHLASAYRERFFRYLDAVVKNVPQERLVPARPEIAGPVFEHLKYVADDSHLKAMYLQLLGRAIDKQSQSEAHPAFPQIIAQLSRDEAVLLSLSRSWSEAHWDRLRSKTPTDEFSLQPVELSIFHFPENLHAYADHLETLGLVSGKLHGSALEPDGYLHAMQKHLFLTHFGYLFAIACIPSEGFAETTT